jgi:hypothetical protein
MVRFKVKPKRGTYKPHHEHHREKTAKDRGRGGQKMREKRETKRRRTDN